VNNKASSESKQAKNARKRAEASAEAAIVENTGELMDEETRLRFRRFGRRSGGGMYRRAGKPVGQNALSRYIAAQGGGSSGSYGAYAGGTGTGSTGGSNNGGSTGANAV